MEKRLIAVILGFVLIGAAPRQEILRGRVVGVAAEQGTIIVRHQPFGGMPAMTMPFAVSRTVLRTVRPRDVIEGTVVEAGSPWSLRDVRVIGVARPERYVPVLQTGALVPDIPLVDQRGKPFSLRSSRGRLAIVSFIYTRCPDPTMCPLVSAKFARLQRMIDPSAMRLVEITLDPHFDTPQVLRRYGSAFGASPERWILATGRPDDVEELSRRLGIVSSEDDRGEVVHSEALVVLSPDGRLLDRIDGNRWTADEALELARTESRRASDPLFRMRLALVSGVTAFCGGGRSGITLAAALAIFLGFVIGFAIFFVRSFGAALR